MYHLKTSFKVGPTVEYKLWLSKAFDIPQTSNLKIV